MRDRLMHGTLIGLALISTAMVWAVNQGSAADWTPVPGHIMTRWAKQVSPDQVLPEYPRPQMVRPQWENLNGLWDYAVFPISDFRLPIEDGTDSPQSTNPQSTNPQSTNPQSTNPQSTNPQSTNPQSTNPNPQSPIPASWQGKILVPFCIESALSGVKRSLTPEQRLWYRRSFVAPDLPAGRRLLLHFGAVDWEAHVLLNGKFIGEHRGGYDAFTLDITDAVKPGGDNELVVAVFDASGGTQARGKQRLERAENPRGIWYTTCSGIWQTVWMETVPQDYVDSLKIVPDIDSGSVTVTVNAKGDGKVTVTAREGDHAVATAEGRAGQPIVLPIADAKLWSPESPFLYDLQVVYGDDALASYFGMRKVAAVKDEKGVTRIQINNREVFQVGLLDQGYWPDGIYTAPTDEALRFDIETTLKLGVTVARKHVKIEPDRWYYWCDKLGLLVWQDMPSPGPRPESLGSGAGRDRETGAIVDGTPSSAAAASQFESELRAMIEGRGNHPSIIMWIVFNEGWGQYDTQRLTQWVKSLDPTRLVNNASGGHDIPAGDIVDAHQYAGPRCPQSTDGRVKVCGEFGGIALPMPGHSWTERTWGYRRVSTTNELTGRYIDLLKRSYELRESEGLAAVIYTQTTDVETECNGMLTYDREIVKPDIPKVFAASRGESAQVP